MNGSSDRQLSYRLAHGGNVAARAFRPAKGHWPTRRKMVGLYYISRISAEHADPFYPGHLTRVEFTFHCTLLRRRIFFFFTNKLQFFPSCAPVLFCASARRQSKGNFSQLAFVGAEIRPLHPWVQCHCLLYRCMYELDILFPVTVHESVRWNGSLMKTAPRRKLSAHAGQILLSADSCACLRVLFNFCLVSIFYTRLGSLLQPCLQFCPWSCWAFPRQTQPQTR